jgi:hypothetical protein
MVLEIIVKVIKEKRHPKWKERSKIVFVCRWYDQNVEYLTQKNVAINEKI